MWPFATNKRRRKNHWNEWKVNTLMVKNYIDTPVHHRPPPLPSPIYQNRWNSKLRENVGQTDKADPSKKNVSTQITWPRVKNVVILSEKIQYKVCQLSIEVIIWATERHLIMPRLNNLCVQSYNNAGKFMNLLLPAIVRFSLRAGQSDYYGEWVREWVSKAEEYVLDYTVQCNVVRLC